MKIKKIEISVNALGLYDMYVDGKTVLQMLEESEIAGAVTWFMSEAPEILEEGAVYYEDLLQVR